MDFKTFVSTIYPLVKGSLHNQKADAKYSWLRELDSFVQAKSEKDVTRETELRGNEVSTGGTRGGGFDGGDSCPYVNDHPEPVEILEMDQILEMIWPTVTYLQYKKLVREAEVKTEGYTQNEYYGNSTNYVYMTVKLGKLYDAIQLLSEGRA
jgi:hypothetical protein